MRTLLARTSKATFGTGDGSVGTHARKPSSERRAPERRARNALAALSPILGALVIASVGACVGGFEPQNRLQSVRVLASRLDQPYARPGEKVTIELLAVDERPVQPAPLKIYWLPFLCVNPPNDLYYACFAQLGGGGSVGPGGGDEGGNGPSAPPLPPNGDVTDFLPTGPTYETTLPADIVSSHPIVPGVAVPYGIAFVFHIACPGRVRVLPPERGAGGPQRIPIGCFDASGNELGPDDFVLGFTRIYAYDELRNQNPPIEGVTLELSKGTRFDPTRDPEFQEAIRLTPGEPLRLPRCVTAKRSECPRHRFDVLVPPTAQEPRPNDPGAGNEQVWATYFSNIGQLQSDARLLFEPNAGRVGNSGVEYRAPNEPGPGTVWVVVRDNRGGANWIEVPIEIE
jgi:hypothetical protein